MTNAHIDSASPTTRGTFPETTPSSSSSSPSTPCTSPPLLFVEDAHIPLASRVPSCSSRSPFSLVDSPPSTSLVRLSLVPMLAHSHTHTGSEPLHIGDYVITQKSLYTALFVIGLPLLYMSSPVWTFFWLVGASSCLILGHAALIEPGVESEYATVQDSV